MWGELRQAYVNGSSEDEGFAICRAAVAKGKLGKVWAKEDADGWRKVLHTQIGRTKQEDPDEPRGEEHYIGDGGSTNMKVQRNSSMHSSWKPTIGTSKPSEDLQKERSNVLTTRTKERCGQQTFWQAGKNGSTTKRGGTEIRRGRARGRGQNPDEKVEH